MIKQKWKNLRHFFEEQRKMISPKKGEYDRADEIFQFRVDELKEIQITKIRAVRFP